MEIVFVALAAVLLVSAVFGLWGMQHAVLLALGAVIWMLWRRMLRLQDQLSRLREDLQALTAAQVAAKTEARGARKAPEPAPVHAVPLDSGELLANAAELARGRSQALKRPEPPRAKATAPGTGPEPHTEEHAQAEALMRAETRAEAPTTAQVDIPIQLEPAADRHAAAPAQPIAQPNASPVAEPDSAAFELPPLAAAQIQAEPDTMPLPLAPAEAAEPVPERAAPATTPAAARRPAAMEPDESSLPIVTSLVQSVLAWFRGGNTIVRVAALILLLGVVFLLRYAGEHIDVPIELRLAAVAAGGLALVRTGWRTVQARRGYGLTLQGAGIAVLYLTLFAAFRRYELMPAALAFVLLAGLAAASAAIAVAQNALPLAVLGFAGGFLAPVLTSSGRGSISSLLMYYLLLNLAIAWIASRQTWKLLNLVGCFLTFSIGLAWGMRSWHPDLLRSTEPFLVAHVGLYLYISIQYSQQLLSAARRQGEPAGPTGGVHYVDGGLLFGMPIAAFALQAGMVKHLPYALAVSAAVLAGVYLLLARWLWNISGQRAQLLTEAMLALGVIFLALVTPLALDARWTGAAWAIQGAGVAWVALKQKRPWALLMGVALQVGAGLSFWGAADVRPEHLPLFANGLFIGGAVLALAALITARQAWIQAQVMSRPGQPDWMDRSQLLLLHAILLGGGVLLTLAAGARELAAASWAEPDMRDRLVWLLLSWMVVAELLHKRLAWMPLSIPGRGLFVGALLGSLIASGDALVISHTNAWNRLWPWDAAEVAALLVAGWWMLKRLDHDRMADTGEPRRSLGAEHLALAWFALLQGAMKLYLLSDELIAHHEAWSPTALMVAPAALGLWVGGRWLNMGAPRPAASHQAAPRGSEKTLGRPGGFLKTWPVAQHVRYYRDGLLLPLLGLLLLWIALANLLADGSMQPLPYLPLLNPIDLGHLLIALYAAMLITVCRKRAQPLSQQWLKLLGVAAFWWINGLLVRTLHHWAGTPMWLSGTLHSGLLQMALTIWWTLTAMGSMLYATHKAAPGLARQLWSAGAALLGVVVVKLLLVDLSGIGTLERIVSFLGVGLLMLVIGYVSPLPPAPGAEDRAATPANP